MPVAQVADTGTLVALSQTKMPLFCRITTCVNGISSCLFFKNDLFLTNDLNS